ncbi:hypothetical protein HYR54_15215 [Candidatus Acetothermia bacterium]|nr:hypothetical protein [Candidatus Acetothermia bacterium]
MMERYPRAPPENSASSVSYRWSSVIERLYGLGEELDELCQEQGHPVSAVTQLDRDWTVKTLRDQVKAPAEYISRFLETIEGLQWYKHTELEEMQRGMIAVGLSDSTGYELLLNEMRRKKDALGFGRWDSAGERWSKSHDRGSE